MANWFIRSSMLAIVALCIVPPVAAAGPRVGTIAGTVTDAGSGRPLSGVTVVAQGPRGEQADLSDTDGTYTITGLAPGGYVVRYFYANVKVERQNVQVFADKKTRLNVSLQTKAVTAETYTITEKAPTVDVGSTRIGTTISRDFTQNVPVGRNFDSVAQPAENNYVVDGLDVTGSHEAFNTETYSPIDENAFHNASKEPLSTFSADVDTASYSNVRRFLTAGERPPREAVRIEELVNYFPYDYPAPVGDLPFSLTAEVGPCAWNAAHRMLMIGLRGRPIADAALPPRNLTFLIDVSGSMDEPNKLPLVKAALSLLVEQLDENDRIAIVVYAGNAGLVLPSTHGHKKDLIRGALASLEAGGSTNGGEGIQLAYRIAQQNFIPGGINRVILATDGDFNVGTTSEAELTQLIEAKRKSGVFLTVLGFGMGNLKDATMEKLADHGNGNYAYIDTLAEARKVLVQQAGATLVTIAKDVKLQVEFNPLLVSSYRLVGYEKRRLRNEDFNDDRKDAGEIGAGHTVTALYEISPTGAGWGDIAKLRIRYKEPQGEASGLVACAIPDPQHRTLGEMSDNFRFAAAVAEYGLLLLDSPHKGGSNWKHVAGLARSVRSADRFGYRAEFLRLVDLASGERKVAGNRW